MGINRTRSRLSPRSWSALSIAGAIVVGTITVTLTGPLGDKPADKPPAEAARHARSSPSPSATLPDGSVKQDAVSPSARPRPSATAGATVRTRGERLTARSGRPFAADSAWNTPIPADPKLAANSDAAAAHLAKGVHANLYEFGSPVYHMTASDRSDRQDIPCLEDWGSCLLKDVPMPLTAKTSSGSDQSMIVIDAARKQVYDFWQLRRTDAGWEASWGTANPLYGKSNENGGAVGAGYSGLAGLVRLFEIRQGRIDHALHFSSDNSCAGRYLYPATKTDGNSGAADCVPEGARVQLDPSVDVDDIPGITRGEKIVAKALQKYGAYNQNNGGAPMAFGFENPAGRSDPYPAAGLDNDYYDFPHIPWNKLRVLSSWNGR